MQFAHVALLAHFWSTSEYADWIKLYTIPGFFALATGGFGSVVINELTIEYGKSGPDKNQRELFVTTLFANTLVTLLLLVMVLMVPIRWVQFFFDTRILSPSQLRIVLACFALQFGVQQLLYFFGGCFRSLRFVVEGILWYNAVQFALLVTSVATIYLGGTPVHLAICFFLTQLAGLALMSLDLYRREANYNPLGVCFSWSTMRRLIVPSTFFVAIPLGHALRQQGLILLLGRIVSDESVVSFNAMRTLSNAVSQLVGLTNRSVLPEYSIAYGDNNIDRMRLIHRKVCQAGMSMVVAAVIFLVVLGPLIFSVWTSGNIAFDYATFYLLLIVLIFRSFWMTSAVIAMATNRHERLAGSYIFLSLLMLAITAPILMSIGLPGAAIGLLLVDITMVMIVVPQSLKFTSDDSSSFLASLVRYGN